MGSHIPIRQLRRSSVNARPRGATLRGLVVSAVFTNTCVTSFPFCRFSVSKRSPLCSSTTVGLRPLSRDISSGFSDSLFFPSALFNSLVRRLGRSSGTYSLEAGPGGPVTSRVSWVLSGCRKRLATFRGCNVEAWSERRMRANRMSGSTSVTGNEAEGSSS